MMWAIPPNLTIDVILSPRLVDYFPEWDNGGGIFSTEAMSGAPWVNDDEYPISAAVLDLVYYANHSGEKLPAPLVSRLAGDDCELTPQQVENLGNVVMGKFGMAFDKQWALLKAQYNPLENYRMTETEETEEETTHGHTLTTTDNLSHRKTGTVTETPDTTETTNETRTPNTTETTNETRTPNTTENRQETRTPNTMKQIENSVAGFNGSSLVNQSGQTERQSGTDSTISTRTETGTESTQTSRTETGTESTQRTRATSGNNTTTHNTTETDTGTKTEANSGTDSKDVGRTLTRYGNIGVTTSQQMLEQERDLWKWNFIEDFVFPAVDSVLALATY